MKIILFVFPPESKFTSHPFLKHYRRYALSILRHCFLKRLHLVKKLKRFSQKFMWPSVLYLSMF